MPPLLNRVARAPFDAHANDDEEAALARLRRRIALRRAVGRGQPNEPGDVAVVETLLRQTGDLVFKPNLPPTGLFSGAQDEAARRFQRRNRLAVDGIVNPDGETLRELEGESFGAEDGDERRREAPCVQNRVDLDNLEIAIDEAQDKLEAANARVVELSETAARFNFQHDLQLAISAISAVISATAAGRAAGSIVAALRAFVRSAGDSAGQFTTLRSEADALADRFDDAIGNFEFRLQELQRLQDEWREMRQARAELGCG